MKCAWNELLAILPARLRKEIDKLGRDSLLELRLRKNSQVELVFSTGNIWISDILNQNDLNFVINAASQYSPWTMASSANGYITAQGGHRIGICGEAVILEGNIKGIKNIDSLCIRVARDHPGIGTEVAKERNSIIIIGAPGWGKTTLLRDVVRQTAETDEVSVVDERRELFPEGFLKGKKMDLLSGCPKIIGIEMMLKTMSPQCIAVDEITTENDCYALLHASNCGVRLMATAHADSVGEFKKRRVYRPLLEERVFQTVVVLHKDKSYHLERMFT